MTSLSAALEARDKLEKLKPCPLCGSTPRLTREKQYRIMIQDWHDKDEELYQLYKIQCPNCGCAIKKSANNAENGGERQAAIVAKEKTIKAWNTRAAPAALDWIAKALPWLRGVKAGMDGLKHKPDDYTALYALIAQAEGKEVGE